jgi:acetyl esterase/lipase
MSRALPIGFFIALIFVSAGNALGEGQFLRSSYELGDPNGYCLDIPGGGPRMRKDDPINTHTCKYRRPGFSNDEEFVITEANHFRMPAFDLCLTADTFDAGALVYTVACAADKVHAWDMRANGQVTPTEYPDLCLTLSSERVFVNSSVANLTPNSTRGISLESCARESKYLQAWRWSDTDELDTPNANTLRAGMSAATAARLRELGNEVKARETAELYATIPRMFSSADVTISDVISYGENDRQRLQVYTGINRNNPQNAAPIILLVHGGGFSRGGLGNFASVATHFAGLGYIAVNMTYPLAPQSTWPGGAQSVASAVRWIKANARDLKGNGDNIFVLGQSAGGALVADFVFRPSLIDGDSPLIAGAILGSPVVELNSESRGGSTVDYFGEDRAEWINKQTLGNIERATIPVLILSAELDPDRFQIGAAKLFNELVVDMDVNVRIRQMRGHNHTSYIASVGTADRQAEEEILDFMATAARD